MNVSSTKTEINGAYKLVCLIDSSKLWYKKEIDEYINECEAKLKTISNCIEEIDNIDAQVSLFDSAYNRKDYSQIRHLLSNSSTVLNGMLDKLNSKKDKCKTWRATGNVYSTKSRNTDYYPIYYDETKTYKDCTRECAISLFLAQFYDSEYIDMRSVNFIPVE